MQRPCKKRFISQQFQIWRWCESSRLYPTFTMICSGMTLLSNHGTPSVEDVYVCAHKRPSSGAANCVAIRELPSISWKPKVHCRVHKRPPLVPVLSHINPIHIIRSYLSKINFNIVHPPTSWSSQCSLSLWISHQYPICIPLLPIRATCPAHLILLD
jgi:hypothetical protein